MRFLRKYWFIWLELIVGGLVIYVIVSGVACRATKYKIGDQVCFRQNNRPASIKWVYQDLAGTIRPISYKVIGVNDLNQVYSIDVQESDLVDCK